MSLSSALATFIGSTVYGMTGRGQRRRTRRARRGPVIRRVRKAAVRRVRLKMARRKQARARLEKERRQAAHLEQQVIREQFGRRKAEHGGSHRERVTQIRAKGSNPVAPAKRGNTA